MRKIKIRYATTSDFKRQEVPEILDGMELPHRGKMVAAKDTFEIEFSSIRTDEPLERELAEMVRHKVRSAYQQLMAPCIVEHAGLILEPYLAQSYPGGLTQPMWDALGAEGFVQSASWTSTRALARSVVGYCDGLRIHTFVGETWGNLVASPRGPRDFYWDTVFCPDGGASLTYAEISGQPNGLAQKIKLSQSTKAMRELLAHLLRHSAVMFPDS